MISFIVPAYNEEALIGNTVETLSNSGREVVGDDAFEIIVVDDASTDRTAEIASDSGARVVSVQKRQIAAVRNAGAREAKGDILIFVDADTLVPPRTLRAALNQLEAGAVGGGANVLFDGRLAPFTKMVLAGSNTVFRWLSYAAGCFIYCRRDVFEAVGGFDERYFASEEIWFSKAMKQQGRCVTLREHVISSGRKIRKYKTAGLFWFLIRLTLRGPSAVQKREGLEIWYDGRREAQFELPGDGDGRPA